MTMRYGRSLYRSNEVYAVHSFKNRSEWLLGRKDLRGIGGSDASAALGLSPWRTNLDLWKIKTGRKEAEDISDSERVQTGILEEEPIRRIFQAETRSRYEVQYVSDVILQNKERPFMLYSPDGLLIEKETGRIGVLEIKTTEIMKSWDREKWGTKEEPRLPDNYYIQILHGMNVTGADFAELCCRMKYPDGSLIIRPIGTYHIDRGDEGLAEELAEEIKGIEEFWKHVEENREPALLLPAI